MAFVCFFTRISRAKDGKDTRKRSGVVIVASPYFDAEGRDRGGRLGWVV